MTSRNSVNNITQGKGAQSGFCYNAMFDKFVLLKSQAFKEMCGGNIENIK